MQGLFITVEGIDGSGKTTVANAVAERLRQEGFAVVVTAALSFGQVGMLKAGDSLYGPGSNFSHRRTI
jgi:thymidylate kinase